MLSFAAGYRNDIMQLYLTHNRYQGLVDGKSHVCGESLLEHPAHSMANLVKLNTQSPSGDVTSHRWANLRRSFERTHQAILDSRRSTRGSLFPQNASLLPADPIRRTAESG